MADMNDRYGRDIPRDTPRPLGSEEDKKRKDLEKRSRIAELNAEGRKKMQANKSKVELAQARAGAKLRERNVIMDKKSGMTGMKYAGFQVKR
jgi:hypothetical protein